MLKFQYASLDTSLAVMFTIRGSGSATIPLSACITPKAMLARDFPQVYRIVARARAVNCVLIKSNSSRDEAGDFNRGSGQRVENTYL